MNIVMLYGKMSSMCHGAFDPAALDTARALTGSESSFFNLAFTLAERAHDVVVFCDCPAIYEHPSGVHFFPLAALSRLPTVKGVGAVISWNEPDLLKYAPAGARRVVDQQLNDWPYCREPGWQKMPDVYVFPSESSMLHHRADPVLMNGVGRDTRMCVVPNTCDPGKFSQVVPRNPHRAVWASSPDRGLHHLLAWWPKVRERVPDAELRVFYNLEPWVRANLGAAHEVGRRAALVVERLQALQGHGVTVCGPVNSVRMAHEFLSAGVLPYSCDPVSYTEGFGCSVLDACAGGCQPIIHNVDALAEVHGTAAVVLDTLDEGAWVDAIASAMLNPQPKTDAMRAHAEAHDRRRVGDEWERVLKPRARATALDGGFTVAEVITKQAAFGGEFNIARVTGTGDSDHASWWTFDDEQGVRDNVWSCGPGDCVLDIGAAFGSYALPALAQGARLVAFNPCDFDRALMRLNLSLNPELERRCLMVADGLYSSPGWFDPVLSRFAPGDTAPTEGEQWLRVGTLDAFLDARPGIPAIDWIKIDVEGAELEVLKGAEKCLRMYAPNILVENHEFIRKGIANEVRDYLFGLGLGYVCDGPHQYGEVSHSFYEAPR